MPVGACLQSFDYQQPYLRVVHAVMGLCLKTETLSARAFSLAQAGGMGFMAMVKKLRIKV
jgi:hypothetical protein